MPGFRLRLAAVAALALPLTVGSAATAHDWYPYTCCSDQDCHPISETDVTAGPDGWVIRSTGEVIGYDDQRVRVTPKTADHAFHRCSPEGRPQGRTICLFVPQFGS